MEAEINERLHQGGQNNNHPIPLSHTYLQPHPSPETKSMKLNLSLRMPSRALGRGLVWRHCLKAVYPTHVIERSHQSGSRGIRDWIGWSEEVWCECVEWGGVCRRKYCHETLWWSCRVMFSRFKSLLDGVKSTGNTTTCPDNSERGSGLLDTIHS